MHGTVGIQRDIHAQSVCASMLVSDYRIECRHVPHFDFWRHCWIEFISGGQGISLGPLANEDGRGSVVHKTRKYGESQPIQRGARVCARHSIDRRKLIYSTGSGDKVVALAILLTGESQLVHRGVETKCLRSPLALGSESSTFHKCGWKYLRIFPEQVLSHCAPVLSLLRRHASTLREGLTWYGCLVCCLFHFSCIDAHRCCMHVALCFVVPVRANL